ncbi:MAG: M10 family metallopeptidase [Xenococcaceae cyanobacterium MO_167.B52]|nr:M10 family metallopeptidase [Xenococcaceae cyanobacterium MO_167.B52]
MFGNSTATKTTSSTGVNNIDALLDGTQWQSNTVTFSFTNSFANDYESGYPNSYIHSGSFESLNGTQRAVAHSWFNMYEDVSNLNMVELTGVNDRNATIRMAESDHPNTGYAYYPGGHVANGDIWFNRTEVLDDPQTPANEYQPTYNNPVIGNYEYHAFGHEIGHALGLKHGHETGGVSNVSMDANRDSMEFSIMTYREHIGDTDPGYENEPWGFAQSLMIYDIAAIQQMYGANFNTNSGNTTYDFSTTTGEMFVNGVGQGTPGGNRIFRTIWDGNGIDTYNFSNYSTNLEIDLTPGSWSNLDANGNFQRAYLGDGNYARAHVFNALQYNGDSRSLIENAIGGSGNDTIMGNDANNILNGGEGDDNIIGGSGRDTLFGDNGNDRLDGGFDQADGLLGEDYLHGGQGNDTLFGNYGNDTLIGGVGNDTIYGNGHNDRLDGESGDDYLYGSVGSDHLIGGWGHDSLYGGTGNDSLYGGGHNDYHDGGDGNDLIAGWNGNDTLIGGNGNDSLYGDGDHDILNGGDGYDTLIGGNGNDELIGGVKDDLLVGGSGDDLLIGSNPNMWNSGASEFDNLIGDAGADIFVLGDSHEAYYLGLASAEILDFNSNEGDKIRVYGSASNYSLSYTQMGDDVNPTPLDTAISYQGDVIGVVHNTTNVFMSRDFIFV